MVFPVLGFPHKICFLRLIYCFGFLFIYFSTLLICGIHPVLIIQRGKKLLFMIIYNCLCVSLPNRFIAINEQMKRVVQVSRWCACALF